jgi:hypothetical protein
MADSSKLLAFQPDPHKTGLELRTSSILRDPGVYQADPAASFEQGMMVSLNSGGKLVLATGSDVFGVAKHNKVNLQSALAIDEEVIVDASGVSQLKHANVSNLVVRTAANQGGTAITPAGDFALSGVNGTLTWVAVPAEVVDGQTVWVSYTYAMTNDDYKFQGRNFFNQVDDVSAAAGRCAVIMAPADIFTTHFDTSRTYSLTGAGAELYCGGLTPALAGLFTNNPAEGQRVGRVIQLPSASDPFMGVRFGDLP